MVEVIGVRFREVGEIYYFSPGKDVLVVGTCVIVETARGLECGTVVISNREVGEENLVQPLKAVRRVASAEDLQLLSENREKEIEAFRICKNKIK